MLDDRQRELLATLSAVDDESWYLDSDGDAARPPISCSPAPRVAGPAGPVKLLCRFLDHRDGSVRFNTPELYCGDLFRWMPGR